MNMHMPDMEGRMWRKYGIAGLIIIGLTGVFASSYACSSVCLNKKGQLILGNNMDWILGDGMVVVNKRNVVKRGFWYENKPDWKWTSKYGSITLTMEGREFPIRGMNEAGLVIVEMMLAETQHPPAGSLPVLSGSQWIQYQLDNSATVKEVIASDTVLRIEPTDWAGMASHFLICDKSGTIACIEWLQGKMTVYTGDKLPIPAMVNSTYESCITSGDDPSGRFKRIADMYAAYDTAQRKVRITNRYAQRIERYDSAITGQSRRVFHDVVSLPWRRSTSASPFDQRRLWCQRPRRLTGTLIHTIALGSYRIS